MLVWIIPAGLILVRLVCFHDGAAGNLAARVAGRLTHEIIGLAVDDDGPSHDVFYGEAFVIEGKPGIARISQKGRQVAGVTRVGGACGIIMIPGISEIV